MDSNFGTTLAPIAPKKKAAARVAMVDLKDATHGVLGECFKQFGVEPIVLPGNAADRLKKEKFEACVVKLGPEAKGVKLGDLRIVFPWLGCGKCEKCLAEEEPIALKA